MRAKIIIYFLAALLGVILFKMMFIGVIIFIHLIKYIAIAVILAYVFYLIDKNVKKNE